jgi:hypothetical protein
MTRVKRNTWSISSFFGTLPNSSWSATAILAFRIFFCSGVGISCLYQNSMNLSSFDTLIMIQVLIQAARLLSVGYLGYGSSVSKRVVFKTPLAWLFFLLFRKVQRWGGGPSQPFINKRSHSYYLFSARPVTASHLSVHPFPLLRKL